MTSGGTPRTVRSILRRAAAFAAVATLSLAAPVLGGATAVPYALLAIGAFATADGTLFELFARPGDRQAGRLDGLASFALAITALVLLIGFFEMPTGVFVATVLLVGYGNLVEQAVRSRRTAEIFATAGFALGGFAAAVAGQLAVAAATGTGAGLPQMLFLAATGTLLAALLRSIFFAREDPLVLFSVGLLLWLFADIGVDVGQVGILVALAVTVGFGYLSWALDTASIPGMLTGILLGLLTLVLGGYGWFVILLAFFAIGGLAAKFRYEDKQARGVAEPQGGARGSGNVLGNSAPALVAVVLFAAGGRLPVAEATFLYAFAGSVGTALADTLSSEVGGLYDAPRLVTTLEPVEPGTDGAVTWQGEVAGIGGAALIAALAALFFGVGAGGVAVVIAAGLLGMTADSLLGATVEGGWLGNQAVNFLATTTGAVVGGGSALALGLV